MDYEQANKQLVDLRNRIELYQKTFLNEKDLKLIDFMYEWFDALNYGKRLRQEREEENVDKQPKLK